MGHIARIGDRTGAYWVSAGKSEEIDHLEDLGVDGSILNGYSRSRMAEWARLIWLRIATDGSLLLMR